jgi:hypothetical protein
MIDTMTDWRMQGQGMRRRMGAPSSHLEAANREPAVLDRIAPRGAVGDALRRPTSAAVAASRVSWQVSGNAACKHPWCKDEPFHTNAEHIDPADRDPYSDASREAERKVNDIFKL